MSHRLIVLFGFVVLLAAAFGISTALAQPLGDPLAPGAPLPDELAAPDSASTADFAVEEGGEAPPTEKESFWEIVRSAGVVGLLIVLLSLGAAALVIEHLLTIRAAVIIPPELGEQVHERLAAGRYGEAVALCRDDPSFLSQVLEAGVVEVEAGWPAVEKAVEDAMGEQSARLLRKIEYLSVIGNIAPMLGLLGTVIGMVMAFRELNISQGAAQASDLAGGIYQALITTVLGLVVAIPSLAAFAVFRNRVDYFVAEVAFVAQHVLGPIKKAFLSGNLAAKVGPIQAGARRTPRATPPPPPPSGRPQ